MEVLIASLKIDKELLLMTPPLSNSDSRLLKIRLSEGIETAPVCVWNTTILDGCEKYEICEKLGIPFEIDTIPIKTKQEAIIWVCKKNLQRDDLPSEIRRFLIGKRYMAELKLSRSIQQKNSSRPNIQKNIERGADRVREVLGTEYSLSPDQLNRYRMYTQALEKMAVAVPELYTKMMNGSIILSVKPTVKYAKLSASDMQELVPQILDKPFDLSRIIKGIPVTERLPRGRPKSKQVYIPPAPITVVMKHDSDAEVMSLASTVQTWTKAIKRVLNSADISCVTEIAIALLTKELSELNMIIDTVNKIIKEHSNVRN